MPSLFDRSAAAPAPVKRIPASQPKSQRPIGRKPGPMPKVWRVECFRTPLSDPANSTLLFEKSFAYRRTAERVLSSLCMRYVGDRESVVEFTFLNTAKGK